MIRQECRHRALVFLRGKGAGGIDQHPARGQQRIGLLQDLHLAAAAQAEGKDFGDTEYSDFDENYTDTYDKKTDSSADENYKPDLDSWATVNNGD